MKSCYAYVERLTRERDEARAEVERLRAERTSLVDALAGMCGERDPKTLRKMAKLMLALRSMENATACNVLADALEVKQ